MTAMHKKIRANKAHVLPTRLEKDPTQQAGNRRKAKAEIARRIKATQEPILALLDAIPVRSVEVNATVYRYDLVADRLIDINNEIRRIIFGSLGLQDRYLNGWFFERYLGISYRQGTAQAAARISSMMPPVDDDIFGPLTTVRPQLELENILMSEPYKRRIELVYARAFENMKGFAGSAADDLARVLATGVANGKSPREIGRNMRSVFTDLQSWRALRIARTEINKAFTDARAEQTVDARDRLGLDVMVMHVSALVPNTRRSHAARHGKIYTVEEQNNWWNLSSNRINCLCSTVEILYIDGKPVQKSLIERQRARGEAYFSAGLGT